MFADSNEKLKASVETLNKAYSELKSAQVQMLQKGGNPTLGDPTDSPGM
jgi:hypothetical protein